MRNADCPTDLEYRPIDDVWRESTLLKFKHPEYQAKISFRQMPNDFSTAKRTSISWRCMFGQLNRIIGRHTRSLTLLPLVQNINLFGIDVVIFQIKTFEPRIFPGLILLVHEKFPTTKASRPNPRAQQESYNLHVNQ